MERHGYITSEKEKCENVIDKMLVNKNNENGTIVVAIIIKHCDTVVEK